MGACSACALRFMMREAEHLCHALSRDPRSAGTPFEESRKSGWKILLAFILMNSAAPFVICWNAICHDITWSGIKYTKCDGKVAKVEHLR